MLIFSIVIYLVVSFFLTARLFNMVNIPKWLITFFLLVVCENILIFEFLHFFNSIDNSTIFLIIQLILVALILFMIFDPKRRLFSESIFPINFKLHKFIALDIGLTTVIIIVLAAVFYIGTISPINNSDSLHTHLPRIYYWLQHGSFESWNANIPTQISYPINISIQGLWIFLLGHSEMLFFVIPWFGLVTAVALIYEISMLLGSTRRGAILASLIALTFPVVLLQTYSFQGDVFVATIILVSVYFLLLFIKEEQKKFLFISGLSLMVAIGAKQTALLVVPVFLLVLIILKIATKINWINFLKTIVLCSLFFLLFSSFKFIQNSTEKSVETSSMIKPALVENLLNVTDEPLEGYVVNALRYFYQSVSMDGLSGKIRLNAETWKNDVFRSFTSKLKMDLESHDFIPLQEETFFDYDTRLPLNEDASWFGPLFYPALLVSFVVIMSGKAKLPKIYFGIGLLLLVIFILGQVIVKSDGWGPNRGRHMIIPVLTLMPLVSLVTFKKSVLNTIYAGLLSTSSAMLIGSVLLFNDSRPVLGQSDLYRLGDDHISNIEVTNVINSQIRKRLYDLTTNLILTAPARKSIIQCSYGEKLFYQNFSDVDNYQFIEKILEEKDTVYVSINHSLLEFSLFGIDKTREVFPVQDLSVIPEDSYLLISTYRTNEMIGFEFIGENDNYQIYRKQ